MLKDHDSDELRNPMVQMEVESAEAGEKTRSDSVLIERCLVGDQAAWSALIDKYKKLIFSVPVKYGLTRDEAGEIFQSVVLELLNGLEKLREPRALPGWLLQVASHKCLEWKRQQARSVTYEVPEEATPRANGFENPESILNQTELEQALRNALSQIPPRCRKMVEMLFFETPAFPYEEVASRLEIATGSIGFIRRRCLDRLRILLEKAGFA